MLTQQRTASSWPGCNTSARKGRKGSWLWRSDCDGAPSLRLACMGDDGTVWRSVELTKNVDVHTWEEFEGEEMRGEEKRAAR